jgi:hypothetical protein
MASDSSLVILKVSLKAAGSSNQPEFGDYLAATAFGAETAANSTFSGSIGT